MSLQYSRILYAISTEAVDDETTWGILMEYLMLNIAWKQISDIS